MKYKQKRIDLPVELTVTTCENKNCKMKFAVIGIITDEYEEIKTIFAQQSVIFCPYCKERRKEKN